MSFSKILLSLSWIASCFVSHVKGNSIETVNADVCIVGGGSSGTYAAVRLSQQGKKVAVIEAQGELGGHIETYQVPDSNQTIDYGVYIFSDTQIVRDFFGHFNIPLIQYTQTPTAQRRQADFRNGSLVPGNGPSDAEVAGALGRYLNQLNKYQSFTGTQGWNLPSPVPEDLLLPFGDFSKKYDLGPLASMFYTFLQGVGNLLAQKTLYIMRYYDLQISSEFATQSFVQNALDDNQLLFDRALTELRNNGSRVFLNSHAVTTRRTDTGIQIRASTPNGTKIIKASKLLVTVPPKSSNLHWLDLTTNESNVFRQFNNSYYWASIVRSTGIPSDVLRITNVDPAAPYAIPAQPAAFVITANRVPFLRSFYYGATTSLPSTFVRSEIVRQVARLEKSAFNSTNSTTPEIVAFADHSPFQLTVSAEQIRNGFYERLQALQGQMSTYWTGAAWYKPASADLWAFTEDQILPRLLE